MNLNDKVTIITGGGQGIGRALSLGFAGYGATVIVADINEQGTQGTVDIIRKEGGKAQGVHLDVTDEASVQALFKVAVETFGGVDIVINNSGVAGPKGQTESVTLDDWRQANSINVDGMFLMCKHAIPVLRNRGKGVILNVSSVSAKRPLIERANYCAAKAAVIGLTRSLALECGQWNIRVNAICPGAVEGPRQDAILRHAAAAAGISFEEAAARKKSNSPLNSFVPPSHIAEVAAFLCSDKASSMTGQDINISAGAWMC
ncbi:MAG: SDR family oxidoreductase [Desulfovibrionales bacterium]|nr:SDR family oxidoreductase [Desulfovibrionales bacterium]